MYDNIVVPVSSYATKALSRTLQRYGDDGYRLVNAQLAKDKYGTQVMYLFFTKKKEKIS